MLTLCTTEQLQKGCLQQLWVSGTKDSFSFGSLFLEVRGTPGYTLFCNIRLLADMGSTGSRYMSNSCAITKLAPEMSFHHLMHWMFPKQ